MNWNERSAPAALAACLALLGSLGWGCGGPAAREAEEPVVRLVVLVSVDQLPGQLFERYDSLYTGGFRRLLNEGRYYRRAVHDHGETWTSSGHATLSTGRYPSHHGIVANRWYSWVDDERVRIESVEDGGEALLGVPGRTGYSPANLEATAVADWLEASDAGGRVVSISAKPTTAITLTGQVQGHVYWYEDDVGRFVTSTYYMRQYPGWVERFNRNALPVLYADTIWECEVPERLRSLARHDSAGYEWDGAHVAFPHRYHAEVEDRADRRKFYDWWDHTPALDVATLGLARAAVDSLALGRRGSVDYLAIGLSQNDRIGHAFGPNSLEQLDNLLRVDRLLGDFLGHLDRTVGPGGYVLALSSDHGTPPVPAYAQERGDAGREPTAEELSAMRRLAREYLAAGDAASAGDRRARIVEALEALDIIADVMTVEELMREATDSFVALYKRSYYPNRLAGRLARYGLVVRYQPGTNWSGDATTHGSPYLYDRYVPLILFGAGVTAGISDEPVRTVDLAPTLAELAGIPYPAEVDGRPLVSR
ncbi:MAG: hypothetical protein GWN99_13025 [Gemmatimonadetes bacterium]|uniref:Alkaline phosphatase family protein n=1 Tax=Candidatus Kutchimonas denitrificans TaxID=3056748 RepID=A0AAE4ZBE4_9BACT|nr:hypothetical protein [Gemmatimonadota bacterium]NIR75801.1 hypothetical protein [Candidatus Kutchimonas denitrificans]NIS01969.1 hypothetical protein [Gemmatimonadota bacterium]NIT67773.1 hypothetical protein [Gemmatimonadota bacterium]NIU53760.1 hypothetical protein [Gemmatimonadota bacterium]